MNWLLLAVLFSIKPYVNPFECKSSLVKFAQEKSDSVHSFDVLHYRLDLTFPMVNDSLKGVCYIDAKSMINNLDSVSLDFVDLTADSIKINDSLAVFNQTSGELQINLGQSFNTGDSFKIEVFYRGYPTTGYYYYLPSAGHRILRVLL